MLQDGFILNLEWDLKQVVVLVALAILRVPVVRALETQVVLAVLAALVVRHKGVINVFNNS